MAYERVLKKTLHMEPCNEVLTPEEDNSLAANMQQMLHLARSIATVLHDIQRTLYRSPEGCLSAEQKPAGPSGVMVDARELRAELLHIHAQVDDLAKEIGVIQFGKLSPSPY